jgi:hypothetical protein
MNTWEVELNEDVAMEYLAESKGMTLKSLGSLWHQENKRSMLLRWKFNEFIEKTGNTITKTSKKHRKIGVQRVMKVD